MSVIAGKVYESDIVISADSIIVRGDAQRTNFTKLVSVNDMLIGCVGLCEESGLMFQFAKTHKPETASERDILSFFVEFAKWKKEFVSAEIENEYLIAYDKHLFSVEGLFVKEVEDFEAIGAGKDFANAVMYLGRTPQEAVKVACSLCCFAAEPITTLEMER